MPRKQRSPSVGATRRLNGKLMPRHEPAFYRSLPYCVSRPFLLENVVVLTALACAAAYLRDDARAVMLVAAAAILHLLLPLEFSLLQGRFPRPFAQFLAQVDTLSSQDISWRKAIEAAPRTGERYCVLGGGGFLGSRVVRALVLRGETNVLVVDMDTAGLAKLKSELPSVTTLRADVRSMDDMLHALRQVDCVIATFALIRFWERLERHFDRSAAVNVEGTRVVIAACEACGVKRLVQTSTGNVTLRYPRGVPSGCTERTALVTARNALHNYALSKAQAEALVLEANCPALTTGSIRPCSNVYGYGDKLHLDRIVPNRTLLVIDCEMLTDWVHVDHLVLAHLLLEAKLRQGSTSPCAGQSFSITGGELVRDGLFFAAVRREAQRLLGGKPFTVARLPARIMHLVAMAVDLVYLVYPGNAVDLLGPQLGILTMATLLSASAENPCRCDKAARLLGYAPHMGHLTAIRKSLVEYREGRALLEETLEEIA